MIGFFNSIPTTIELNGPVLSFTGPNTLQPVSTSFCDNGSAGFVGYATAAFPVQSPTNPAENTGYIEYHWHEVGIGQLSDSAKIVGSATTFLTLYGLKSPQDNGRKFFLRADYVNSAYAIGKSTGNAINESLDSGIVTLGVRPNIGIATQPSNTTIPQGASAKLSIGANTTDNSNSSLAYQWYANNNLLVDGKNLITMNPSPNSTQNGIISGWNGAGIYLDLISFSGSVNVTITTSEESGIFHYINIPGVSNIPENLGKRTFSLQGGRIYGPCTAPYGSLYIGNETPVGGSNTLVVEEGGDDWNDMILSVNVGFFARYNTSPQPPLVTTDPRMTITNISNSSVQPVSLNLSDVTSYSSFNPGELYTIVTNKDVKVQAYLKGGKGGTSTYLRSVDGGDGGTASGIITLLSGVPYLAIRGSASINSTAGIPGGGSGNGAGGGGGYSGLFLYEETQSIQSSVTHIFDNVNNIHTLTQTSPDITVEYMNPSAADGLPCSALSYGKYYRVRFKVPFVNNDYSISIDSFCNQAAGGNTNGPFSVDTISNKSKEGFDIWFCRAGYNSYIRCFTFTTVGGVRDQKSSVFDFISSKNAILVAGGGGGGSNDPEVGGKGGGLVGGHGQAGNKGGTQSAGGSGDNHAGNRAGSSGSALKGGSGAAGGGGGYYGGGGGGGYNGCCDDWAGGGGSGYINSSLVSSGTFTATGKNDIQSTDGILILDILSDTLKATCTVSGAKTPNLSISCDTIGTLSMNCLVTHPTACNSPLLSDTVALQVVNANQILNIERIEQSGTSLASLTTHNLYSQGAYTMIGSGSVNPALFSFYAAERDLDVFIDLYGGAGTNYGSNLGGQGGVSTIRLSLKKNVEYVIAGLSAGGAVYLYRQATLIAVVGAGGNAGSAGAGGNGGGVNVAGGTGFGKSAGSGGSLVPIGGLTTNGSFGSAYPQASSSLMSGDSNSPAPNGGRVVSCPKGNYWRGVSPCSIIGTVQFYVASGTRITNSASIERGFKAGYGIRNTAGAGDRSGGDGGNGATGGAGGYYGGGGGGGGGSGYCDGSIRIISTQQGGNSGVAKVVIRTALV